MSTTIVECDVWYLAANEWVTVKAVLPCDEPMQARVLRVGPREPVVLALVDVTPGQTTKVRLPALLLDDSERLLVTPANGGPTC